MASELNSVAMWSAVSTRTQRSFGDNHAIQVLLPSQMELFTVSHMREIPRGGAVPEFWSPVKPYRGDPGLRTRVELTRSARGNTIRLMRAMSATDGSWQTSRYALIIRLQQPVWAFFGLVEGQERPGGLIAGGKSASGRKSGKQAGYQFFVPGLVGPEYFQQVKAQDLIFG